MSLFRKVRELKRPTNGSGQGGVRRFPRVIFIYIILGAWILLSSFFIVDADEQGVVKRFGKYNRTEKSGIHSKFPWPIESVQKPKVTEVKRIEIGFRTIDPGPPASYRHIPEESLMLTGDLNIVSSEFIVQYRIKSAEEYLFNVKDVGTAIRDAAEAAKRQVVGDKEVDYVLTVGKAEIQEEVRSLLQKIMDSYGAGIHIVAVQLQDVEPPKPVIGAFKDVASAKEDRDKYINQAEAYRNEIIPTAQGEAKKLLNEAEAYKFVKILDESKKNEDVTRKRLYLETMESVLSGMDKFIIDSKNSSSLNILELRGKTSDEIKKELEGLMKGQ